MSVELSDAEMLRYNRQIILRDFDFDGQEQLKASRVLVVGLGGLGCAAAPARRQASACLPCSISTPFRSPTFSARLCTVTPPSASRRSTPPAPRWRGLIPTFSSRRSTRGWKTRRWRRKSPPTIWCSTVPTTSRSVTSSTPDVSAIKHRWSPARQFAWKGKSAFLPGRKMNPATAA